MIVLTVGSLAKLVAALFVAVFVIAVLLSNGAAPDTSGPQDVIPTADVRAGN